MKTFYDYYEIHLWDCAGILAICVFALALLVIAVSITVRTWKERRWGLTAFFIGMDILAVFFSLVIIPFEIIQFRQVYVAYQEGRYETVTGIVEDFIPYKEKVRDESFRVEDVTFSFSPSRLFLGYKRPRTSGGGILEGSNVSIRYIEFGGYNQIMKITINPAE